jgi:hypothetical protein
MPVVARGQSHWTAVLLPLSVEMRWTPRKSHSEPSWKSVHSGKVHRSMKVMSEDAPMVTVLMEVVEIGEMALPMSPMMHDRVLVPRWCRFARVAATPAAARSGRGAH